MDRMGVYLNSKSLYLLFRREYAATYFMDKTEMIKERISLVKLEENRIEDFGPGQGKGQKYVCLTRLRRFGKTVMEHDLLVHICNRICLKRKVVVQMFFA